MKEKQRILLTAAIVMITFVGILGYLLYQKKENSELIVGKDILAEDITEFYFTYSTSTNPPIYERFLLSNKNGRKGLYHEVREGDHFPLTEDDISESETLELDEKQWQDLFDTLKDGAVIKRKEDITDGGGRSPYLFLYWKNDQGKYQQYSFASFAKEKMFEDLCREMFR